MPNSFQEWMNELNHFAKDAHHKGMLEEIGNERYIVELIGRVVRVSVETQEIVDRLPSVEES